MEFRILGPVEVLDGLRRVDLPAGRARALLALFILRAGEAVAVDRIIDDLWGEHPPPTVHTIVQGFVSRLRKILEPGRDPGEQPTILQTAGQGYRLAIDPEAVDAHRFTRLLEEARDVDHEARSSLLRGALALWRGPALADFTYEPFAQQPIAALEELRVVAIEERIDTDLALGLHGQVIPELERLLTAHPFRERIRGQLMLALYRSGRQRDALAAYRDAREALVEELAIEPGPALRRLERAILKQDPSLDLPAPAVPRPTQPVRSELGWLPRERRTVTALVADLAASYHHDIDAEALDRLIRRAMEVATGVLHRYGARVEPAAGQAFVGLFGLPRAHEDDAVRALRAAAELSRVAETLAANDAVRFVARAGIDTGEVIVGPVSGAVQGDLTGPVVASAARLHEAARAGEVLAGTATQRLVRGRAVLLPAHDLGVDPVKAWRLRGDVSATPVGPPDAPMRGRQRELTSLRTAFRTTVRTATPSWLTVLGEAGIGKSTLAAAFARSIGTSARVVTGHCLAYGEGITFLPLREALFEAAGSGGWAALASLVGSDDAEQIAAAIGLRPAALSPDQQLPAVRRLIETLARQRPLVIVIEDIHWAEPTLIELLDYISTTASGAIFLLGLARPELLAEARRASTTLTLDPLPEADLEQLIVDRATAALDPDEIRRIVREAGGNPLFAEQLLAALAEADVDVVPASLRSLLAMRLDRLGPAERDLLRCAAVIGPECDEAALTAVLPDKAHPFLARHLDSLVGKQLIERTAATTLSFRHILIQLAAYQSMTRQDRARLHERYAGWLEAVPSAPPELDEIVGYHLEQAVEHRRAIGAIDATLPRLATRAGERLMRAAERALARVDNTAAENLLSRARTLLPIGHPQRVWVSQRLAETDLVLGRHRQGQEVLDELIAHARASGDTSYERFARLERARIQLTYDPEPLSAIRREAQDSIAFYSQTGDAAGRNKAEFLLGCVLQLEGRIVEAAQTFLDGLAVADSAAQVREAMAYRWMLAETTELGPMPVADCIELCERLVNARGMEHPGVLIELAMLNAMRGRFDEARRLNDRARQLLVEQVRARRLLRWVAHSRAWIELMAAQYSAAEREFRVALASTRELGERESTARVAAGLASTLFAQGKHDEAAAFAAESAQAAPPETVEAQARSLAAFARAASAASNHYRAENIARQAVDRAPQDMPNLRGDVMVDLAEVLRAAGHEREAMAIADGAARLYEGKGNTASMARIERFASGSSSDE
jgi:DNA-binding SARP family transcriptional activator/tetratricopeptide (TPR) repeat protein